MFETAISVILLSGGTEMHAFQCFNVSDNFANNTFKVQDFMTTKQPDNTALWTALCRALHIQADDKPYLIEDEIGYDLIKPEKIGRNFLIWNIRKDLGFYCVRN